MEINLTYRDIESILMTKFNINSTLNPDPLWYSDKDDEFDNITDNRLDDIIIKLRVNSDFV